jgi:malto-oligosyltrehalose trehalohydrolase
MIHRKQPMIRRHTMPFGAEVRADGSTRFRFWAPSASSVEILLEVERDDVITLPMPAVGAGWYELVRGATGAGTLYRYRIDGALEVPDPASRFNPRDVHGPSEVIDPGEYRWHDTAWSGRSWHDAVVYELHVGTFTRPGTFAGLEKRLDTLARDGITALELMPVADFPGQRGWGYDGVLLYAPESAYGRPEKLKSLIEAAHERGLMVLLDVVYNHFGPEGNYLHAYARPFFTDRHRTPWGDAINFDGDGSQVVRDFFIENALYWLEEYHLDGLRIDAVHAIRDDSPQHFIAELAERVRSGPGKDRETHLILENHENEAHFLRRDREGRPVRATAQWNDDIHHTLHTLLTSESDGYYVDFATTPLRHLGRGLAEGFAFQGDPFQFEDGRLRGESSRDLPPGAFVNFLQNHDQVGNRAFGERISQLTGPARLRAAMAILLLAPAPPMLFMGDEFAASQPFLYFCDFGGELAEAVTEGRRREFARFAQFSDADARARIPDPNAPQTFAASKLRWSDRERRPHQEWLRLTRLLLDLRRREIVPLIPHLEPGRATWQVVADRGLIVDWPAGESGRLVLEANLGNTAVEFPAIQGRVRTLYRSDEESGDPGPWQVRWLRVSGRS